MSSKDGRKLSVPKFTSFKRKLDPPPIAEEADHKSKRPNHADRRSPGVEKTGRSSIRGTQSHGDASALAHRGARTDSHESRGAQTHGREPEISGHPARNDLKESLYFFVDRRGDPLIRRYGGNNRYNVPTYRRFGAGRFLGSDGYFRVDRVGNREEFAVRDLGERSSVLSERRSALTKALKGDKPVKIRGRKSQTYTISDDFLPLGRSHEEKPGKDDGQESPNGYEGPSYRSIHGMSKKNEQSDNDGADDSDTSTQSSKGRVVDPLNLKSIEFSTRVKDHPDDIDAWIDLVDHQDALLNMGEHDSGRATQAEIKSYADIKLSLLQRALKHAKSPTEDEELRLRIMREGSKIWDQNTILQRWKDLVREHGASFDIWRAYVDFEQANLATLRYDKIKHLIIERMRHVKGKLAEQPLDADRLSLYEQLLKVFVKATLFAAEAGYSELATAAWQAILELHFRRPQSTADTASIPPSFQDFWESEVPRLGDESAKGWQEFEEESEAQGPPDPNTFRGGNTPSTRDPYKAWAAAEERRAQHAKIPARTMDDGTEDDPYRVIMYADIQEILLYIPSSYLSAMQGQIIDAFLVFHHFPPAFGKGDATGARLRDDFINGGVNSPVISRPGPEESERLALAGSEHSRPPDSTYQYQTITKARDVLFPLGHWFSYIRAADGSLIAEQLQLISNTLKQLVATSSEPDLATYCLAFEGVYNANSSKKLAKTLLKRQPLNTDLYVGFATLEFARGNKESATTVITAALSLPSLSQLNRYRLCIAGANIELEAGHLTDALLRLCQAPEGTALESSVTPALVLRTRQMLVSNRDYHLISRQPIAAAEYSEGLALLDYLTKTSGKEPQSTNQGDIWSAMASVTISSDEISARGFSRDSSHAILLQSAARLLYIHASRGPYRPAFFRDQVARFIEQFPQNTIFLSLCAWREQRLNLDDRVRSILDRTVLTTAHDCVSSRVFAIRHEMATGNAHSTRAAFERAVETDSCKHHVGIWVSYIRFCYHSEELRLKAENVFYRAIQHCPWSKRVFMEAFITLIREMDSSKLRSIYNTLCEKGLRVHIELDEFVEKCMESQRREKHSHH